MKKIFLIIVIILTLVSCGKIEETDWTKEYVNEIIECEGYDYYLYTSESGVGNVALTDAEDIKIITFYLDEGIVTYLVYHKGSDIDWEVYHD